MGWKDVANVLFRPLFGQWIAGTTPKQVLQYAREVQTRGGKTTIYFLGEKQITAAAVNETVNEYLNLLTGIQLAGVHADVAFKPSQLGFDLLENSAVWAENAERIVRTAQQKGIFCWMDMESLRYVDATLEAYQKLRQRFSNVGICLLANLKRTEKDLERLASKNATVRLVKGVYPAPADQAYAQPQEIDAAYERLIQRAAENKKLRIAVATHDEKFLALARKTGAEVQMLKGVRPSVQRQLLKEGVPLNIYAPYGKNVFAYGVRRARETKHGVWPKMLALFFGWLYDRAYVHPM